MALILEDMDVAGSFEDLSDVQMAFLQQELGGGDDLVDAVMVVVKPVVTAMARTDLWAPLPGEAAEEAELGGHAFSMHSSIPLIRRGYTDARDEVYYRMEDKHHVGEVELFLRKCLEFYGRSWQPMENLMFVAHHLALTEADKLTTRKLMLKTGPELVQGTWFPYWEQGVTHASGAKQVMYRLARPFFGDFSGVCAAAKK